MPWQKDLVVSSDYNVFELPQTDAEKHFFDAFVEIRDRIETRREEMNAYYERDDPRWDDVDIGEYSESDEINNVCDKRPGKKDDENYQN